MKKRIISLLLTLALLAVCPAALAEKTWQSHTDVYSASSGQLENILLAAEALDGVEVDSGESFSFNDIVGPRTQARGYVRAENGRGVMVTGGGVAQAAATLYLALLQIPDGIRFDEVSTYGNRFTGDYVSDGDLAVITDYSAGTDFRFTNKGGDLEIEMWVSGGNLYCTITQDEDDWFDDDDDDDDDTLSARIPWGDEDGVLNNIELAAESIYDTTLGEGDVFSFNDIVGPRTGKYGYVNGTNGRGARVLGGGVAQVASVIWLAIKHSDDFEILEKTTYGKKYNQDYVESASDAIVTDYSADTDFSFRYVGDGDATIYTYVEGDYLRCNVVISD
jgi:vancomycin resistance protein YoaR